MCEQESQKAQQIDEVVSRLLRDSKQLVEQTLKVLETPAYTEMVEHAREISCHSDDHAGSEVRQSEEKVN